MRTHVNRQSMPKDREGGLIGGIVANENWQRVRRKPLEEALGGATLADNSARKQFPDFSPLQQAQARPEMITGSEQGLPGNPYRRQLGPSVMDRQRITLILDGNAGQSGEALREPELGLVQQVFLRRRKCGATPFPAVETEQSNPRDSHPPPKIGQPSSAHDVDSRSPMLRQPAKHPLHGWVETHPLRVVDRGHQRAIKIQEQQPTVRRPEPSHYLRPGIEKAHGKFFPLRRYPTSTRVSSRISQRSVVRSAAQR